MRLFENIILFILLVALAWSFLPEKRRPRISLYLPALSLVVIAVSAIVEGLRWQMVPAYIMAVVLFFLSYRRIRSTGLPPANTKPVLRLLGVLSALVLFIIISQLPALIPVFLLPEPGGPYEVGTFSLNFIDTSRQETFTTDPDDFRQIPVQVWYPAENISGEKPVNYWFGRNEMSRILAEELGLPFFMLDHIAMVKTHSIESAPVAAAQQIYPVLLFSHGYRLGYLQQNFSIMETLASHGYIILSVAHPYEVLAAPLADDQLVRYAGQYEDLFYEDENFRETSLKIWTADFKYVLDSLEGINNGQIAPLLSGYLDLDHVGLFGMSFGGSTASVLCLEDTRCKAGMALDSPQYNAVKAGNIDQPFLFMVSATGKYLEREVYENALGPAYLLTIQDSIHYDFTDLSLVSPLGSVLGFNGQINGEQMVRILNAYTLAFFDKHLKNLPGAILNGISAEYPEVSIESRNLR